jgi:glycosyltransferase involved in cell wall biosynthesis
VPAKRSIDLFCHLPHPGQPAEDDWAWGPPSVESGIGGSEEAVIYLARELAGLGHTVTVFNQCGPYRGTYDGVAYRPYQEFQPDTAHDVVVSWRRLIFLEREVVARRKFWWLHDNPKVEEWMALLPGGQAYFERTPAEAAATFDRVIVLSRFHRSLLPEGIPDDHVYVSRNGLHVPDFVPDPVAGPIPRNPRRVIYPVSYARGLEHLLRMWPAVLTEVPDAELHIFYGWQTVFDPEEAERLRGLLQQPGVFEHGQIGHRQLVDEYRRSGIYAYPAHTPEVFSIATLKAAACGCVSVVTDCGALSEVTMGGVVVPGHGGQVETDWRFQQELVSLLKNTVAQEVLRMELDGLPLERFGWRSIAEEWDRDLLGD